MLALARTRKSDASRATAGVAIQPETARFVSVRREKTDRLKRANGPFEVITFVFRSAEKS
jgi:hypothetical protein